MVNTLFFILMLTVIVVDGDGTCPVGKNHRALHATQTHTEVFVSP